MKLSIDNSKFAVYDEVFSEQDFKRLWNWIQTQDYEYIGGRNWHKVWRISDGSPLGGHMFKHTDAPFDTPLDLIHNFIVQIEPLHPNLLGDWNTIVYRSYIYPPGSKIDWHSDQGYTAAAVFYTHPKWLANWGGELQIAEVPKNYKYENVGVAGQIETSWKNDFLNIWGVGQYITPKPNRLVITPAGTWHSISRVDPDAGDNCRCAVVCFFKKE